jgi:hypothetical protein
LLEPTRAKFSPRCSLRTFRHPRPSFRSLERDPEKRFQTAREFAIALEQAGAVATAHTVGEWVKGYGGEELQRRQNLVQRVESHQIDMEALTAREEVSTKSESTSGVLVPVDSDVDPDMDAFRRPRGIVTLTLLLLGAGLGGLIGRQLLFTSPPAAPVVEGSSASPQPVETVVVVREVTKEVPNVAPDEEATATPSASAEPAAPPTTKSLPVHVPVRPPARPSRPSRNCDPPYTVDPVSGVRKIKPQCM